MTKRCYFFPALTLEGKKEVEEEGKHVQKVQFGFTLVSMRRTERGKPCSCLAVLTENAGSALLCVHHFWPPVQRISAVQRIQTAPTARVNPWCLQQG